MRVLVIGASGQIGGHLFAQLQAQGHTVAGTYASQPRVGLVKLDTSDATAVEAAIKDVNPHVVILPAGWTWVDGCEDDPARCMRVNKDEPLAVARAAARVGARFVTYSTDYVFDGKAGPHAEDGPTNPLSVYGRAKLEAEQAILGELPHALVLRTTTVFGPESQGKNFVYQAVKRLKKKEPLVVPNDQWANPSYGPDVAKATLELVDREARGIWHLAGPEQLDRASFARRIAAAWNLDPAPIQGKTTAELKQKAARPLIGGLDVTRLETAGLALRGLDDALAAMRAEIEAGRAAPIG